MASDTIKHRAKRPAVGVAGVVWREDQFLLIQRGKEPNKGSWALPGGHQEWGETVRQGVAREVLEETGLEVEVGALIDVVDAIVPGPNGQIDYHYTLLDYRCEWTKGEPVAGDDAADVRWATLDELEDPGRLGLWEETGRIIRASVDLNPAIDR